MNYSDPYQAYAEGSLLNSDPVRLVISLYEGAIKSAQQARQCLSTGDIWGRSRSITKAVEILTELLLSLDHEKGGEMSQNLKRLYSYMQCKLLEAHAKRAEEPIAEVEQLLNTLLQGWYAVAESKKQSDSLVEMPAHRSLPGRDESEGPAYGGYFNPASTPSELSFTF